MTQDDRDILDVLKFELSFLEDGGYGRSPHAPWRAPAVFEDSPICPNFCDPARPHPCDSCLLEQFVPQERRADGIPCRHIRLNEQGQTVEDLYRTGNQVEITGSRRVVASTDSENRKGAGSRSERTGSLISAPPLQPGVERLTIRHEKHKLRNELHKLFPGDKHGHE